MQTPAFVDGQFVDGTLLNGAVAQLMTNFELIGSELHTPGLLSPSSLTVTASGGLAVTVSAPSPFGVLFGTGLVANANGVVSGAISSTYVVNFTSLVPGSGSVTAYILASYGQIGEQLTQVVGPPEGHPDYNPTFAPFQWYLEDLDTLAISASTTPPDNVTTFALAQLPLSVGQSNITQGSISYNWTYASAVLNPTGVSAGSYTTANVTVGSDGRLTAIASGPNSGRLLNVQNITASATYSPTAGTNSIEVEVFGGGGGGGGAEATGAGQCSAGAGGGGGGYAKKRITSGFSGATMTIGAGGVGTANAAGTAGGTTSFGSVSATGGSGGTIGPPETSANTALIGSGPPGSGSGGDLNWSGGYGGQGFYATSGALGGGGGANGKGNPGASPSSGTAHGNAATNYGAGGGGGNLGASSGGGTAAGGNGMQGLIIIYEYS